jgi:hypothetical protein
MSISQPTLKPTGWDAWSAEEKAAFVFTMPPWSHRSLLAEESEKEAARIRNLVEQRWKSLSDEERLDLLIEGPQWMREGVRARVGPEEGERLEGMADSRWTSKSEEEKVEVLAGIPLVPAREVVLRLRESRGDQRARLLEIANERANKRVRHETEEWMHEHPDWHRHQAAPRATPEHAARPKELTNSRRTSISDEEKKPIMPASELKFGYNRGVPEGIKTAWGARLVAPDNLVWDCQDLVAENKKEMAALVAWLNGPHDGDGALEELRLQLRDLYGVEIFGHEAKEVVLYEDARGKIVGKTNGSGGYVYVVGFLKP